MTNSILNDPFKNKGTGFTQAERQQLGIIGMLPPKVQTLDEQATQVYQQYQTKPSALEKRIFLMSIFNENRVLFFKVFSQHVAEFMPIVYNPQLRRLLKITVNYLSSHKTLPSFPSKTPIQLKKA